MDWILRIPTTRIHHLNAFHSDHKPILLVSDSKLKQFYCKGRPFQFEVMWIKDKACEDVIKDSWADIAEPSPMQTIAKKIKI